MKLLRVFLLGILLGLVGAPLQASAEAFERDGGMYISFRGGLAQVRGSSQADWAGYDPTYETVVDPETGDSSEVLVERGLNDHHEYRSLEMNYGYVAGVSLGYTAVYPDNSADLRFELEAMYRKNDDGQVRSDFVATTDKDDSDSLDGTLFLTIGGYVEVRSAMFNVLLDFHTPTRITPYLGLGVGMSQLIASGSVGIVPFDDDEYGLSWQAIAGVGYHLTPGTMLTLEFRYFRLAVDRWSDLFQTNELRGITFDDWSMGVRMTF
ncbi:MAG: porin family protein [Proteobacteria bacterium]|nr:porin family protein [Pseudomonadota bacterium]